MSQSQPVDQEVRMKVRILVLVGLVLLVVTALMAWPVLNRQSQVKAAPDIYASPIHGGCYIAGPSDCRLHVEPFTINLASGRKLVYFQLLAASTSGTKVIYDFRPDLSNPVPYSGSTFTPSLVAQDFAATCGKSYTIHLQGQDTGDANPLSLGATGQFTCPLSIP
jgi:hypothetical protein